jgi:hypothetical protein
VVVALASGRPALGVDVAGLGLGVPGLAEIEFGLVGDLVAIVVEAIAQLLRAKTLRLFHQVSPIEMEKVTAPNRRNCKSVSDCT